MDKTSCEMYLSMIKGGFAKSMQGIDPQGGEVTMEWVLDELMNFYELGIGILDGTFTIERKDNSDDYDGEGAA